MKSEIVLSGGGVRQIVFLEQARVAISKATDLQEIRQIRDKAEAIRQYVRAHGESLAIQNQAAEIKIRAERRAGELLAEMEKHPAGRPEKNRSHDVTDLPPKLADLGIDRMQSHRWQAVATIPEKAFEKHIEETKASAKELTSASVQCLAKTVRNSTRNTHVAEKASKHKSSKIETLADHGEKYACIYADPPWQYGNQATRAATDNHYPTMRPGQIAAMPIKELAADNAHLHLWTTNAFLFECQQIMEAWGFEYKSIFVWVKPQMGIGNYWRVSHELMLFGIRGDCPFLDHGQKSWLELPRTGHSTKPEKIRSLIEKVSPGPRLELFARRRSPGWSVWGNQIEDSMFDVVEEAVA